MSESVPALPQDEQEKEPKWVGELATEVGRAEPGDWVEITPAQALWLLERATGPSVPPPEPVQAPEDQVIATCPNCGMDYPTAGELRAWKDEADIPDPVQALITQWREKPDGHDFTCPCPNHARQRIEQATRRACADQLAGIYPSQTEKS